MEVTIADVFRYYIAWKDTDEKLTEGIVNGDEDSFYDYLKGMKVIRNFKKGSHKEILKLAKNYKKDKTGQFNVEKFSDELYETDLLAGDNKNAIVAASKILWIYDMKKIVIQDSRAKLYLEKVIGKKISGYTDYCKTWEEQYLLFKPEYLKLIKKIGIDKQDNLFNEDWFIRRTFDNYLWNRGKAEEKNKSKEKK